MHQRRQHAESIVSFVSRSRDANYSSSRCVLLGPTAAGRNQIIFVDPGRGGQDPGAVGRTSAGAVVGEKDLTLAIGLALAPLLRADGFGVVLSRTGDTTVAQLASGDEAGGTLTVQGVHHDLQARIDCANAAHASFLLVIHFDAVRTLAYGLEPRIEVDHCTVEPAATPGRCHATQRAADSDDPYRQLAAARGPAPKRRRSRS